MSQPGSCQVQTGVSTDQEITKNGRIATLEAGVAGRLDWLSLIWFGRFLGGLQENLISSILYVTPTVKKKVYTYSTP
jgi:hypothetical protein